MERHAATTQNVGVPSGRYFRSLEVDFNTENSWSTFEHLK